MIAYFLFFAVAGLPALFYWRKNSNVGWVVAWILYVLFIGLRHHVGGDWWGYMLITERISGLSFAGALRDQEPLFGALTWLSTKLGWGVYGANLIGAMIFCTGLFSYCNQQKNRWLALAAATPFLVIVAVMSANRQGIAIGIVLFVMAYWDRFSLRKRAAGFLLAGMFHSSALLLLWMPVMDLRIGKVKKLFLLAVVMLIGFWLLTRSEDTYYRYTTVYVQQPEGVYSPGAMLHLFLNLFPAVLMLTVFRRAVSGLQNWTMLRQLCLMALGLAVLAPFFSVAAGRMSLYLFPLSITFISLLPGLFKDASARAIVRILCVVSLGGVLTLWLLFANTAFTYRPYQNLLTMMITG